MENATNVKSDRTTKLCPHCKSEIDAGATRCPHCQGKIHVSRQLKFDKKWVIGIGIFVALATLGAVAGGPNQGNAIVMTGNQGYLRNTVGALGVIVARTKDVESAITKAVDANDPIGVAQIVDSGAALNIPNGTPVQVIDMGFGISEVRILGGSHLGESGWVPAEDVSAQ